jgi:hypothetical protein
LLQDAKLIELSQPQSLELSAPKLNEVLGGMVHLPWQGRADHEALTHIRNIYFKSIDTGSNYLLVHGSPGSGKTRFLIEVASRLQPKVLRLACTFNYTSPICKAEMDGWANASISLPVTARLLYHYARNVNDRRLWEVWLKDFQKIPSIGQFCHFASSSSV